MATHGYCPHCRTEHVLEPSHVAKVLLPAVSALATGASTDSISRTVAAGFAGLVVGAAVDAAIDEFVEPTCPTCGAVLRTAASVVM